ncbi:hypothetical protein OIU77_007385 [Salix suchowensis]|uniref:Cyclin n=1 Tax=Salix suchowensis TaxID=1278906 RepID=A0ABQ9AH78_9ROSI|nr:hypothetical protein OIU77_007385 [Salix suchowensis]
MAGLAETTAMPKNYLERIFKLLITSVLISVKFMDDIGFKFDDPTDEFIFFSSSTILDMSPDIRYYNNAFYAKVGGISTREMNLLEVDFLFGLGFQLNVTPATFHLYCSYLQRDMWIQSPLGTVENPLNIARPLKTHCCFQ